MSILQACVTDAKRFSSSVLELCVSAIAVKEPKVLLTVSLACDRIAELLNLAANEVPLLILAQDWKQKFLRGAQLATALSADARPVSEIPWPDAVVDMGLVSGQALQLHQIIPYPMFFGVEDNPDVVK